MAIIAPIGAPTMAAVSRNRPMRKLTNLCLRKVEEAPDEVQITAINEVANA